MNRRICTQRIDIKRLCTFNPSVAYFNKKESFICQRILIAFSGIIAADATALRVLHADAAGTARTTAGMTDATTAGDNRRDDRRDDGRDDRWTWR